MAEGLGLAPASFRIRPPDADEHVRVMRWLESRFPIAAWGRIDWAAVDGHTCIPWTSLGEASRWINGVIGRMHHLRMHRFSHQRGPRLPPTSMQLATLFRPGKPLVPALLTACVAILLLGIAADSYTLYADNAHAVRPAPWWQTAIALGSAATLIAYVALVWKRRYPRAVALLLAGGLIDVLSNVFFVARDGLDRFSSSFGDREFLSLYLGLLALRLVMLGGTLLFAHYAAVSVGRLEPMK